MNILFTVYYCLLQPGNLCVDFNSTSSYLLVGGEDSCINVWDLKSRKIKKTYKVEILENYYQFRWSWLDRPGLGNCFLEGHSRGYIVPFAVPSELSRTFLYSCKSCVISIFITCKNILINLCCYHVFQSKVLVIGNSKFFYKMIKLGCKWLLITCRCAVRH